MLTRRRFLQIAAAGVPLGAAACGCARRTIAPHSPRPNIVLFLADDMGVGDTSAYQDFSRIKNSGQVLTPVMQRFADSGVRFTDAHSPGPACAPTRRGIMMGDFERSAFGSAATLPEMLRRGEYRIYGVGKWHLPVFEHHLESPGNEPIARGPFSIGFHHYAGTQGNIRKSKSYFVDRTVMIYDEETKKLVPNDSADEPGYDKPGGPREEISQQLWLDYARKWMAEHLESEPHANSPFFLYYPSHANHMNYRPPKHLDGIRVEGACRTADGQPLPEDRDGLIKARSEMIAENDAALGILLDWLENHDDPRNPGHKLIDNTFFIFTSDNGANVDPGAPAHGPLGARKTQQKEGGHRVPLIARWGDRFPARSTSAETISQVDFYATFAAAAGVDLKPEEALDSFNIIDATLRPGSKRKVRQAGILTTGLRTARLENFKAIADPDGNFIEIYDLGKDLGETNNLIGLPEYAKQEKALREFVEKSRRDGRTRPK